MVPLLRQLRGESKADHRVPLVWRNVSGSHQRLPRLGSEGGTLAFRVALSEATGWEASGRACLHWALGYLAERSGRPEEAAREFERAQQLDAAYRRDVDPVAAGFAAAYGIVAQQDPAWTIDYFYDRIATRDFAKAWGLLTPGFQSSQGSYANWVRGYDTTLTVAVLATTIETRSTAHATVRVSIDARDSSPQGTITRKLEGTWKTVLIDGRWFLDAAAIAAR